MKFALLFFRVVRVVPVFFLYYYEIQPFSSSIKPILFIYSFHLFGLKFQSQYFFLPNFRFCFSVIEIFKNSNFYFVPIYFVFVFCSSHSLHQHLKKNNVWYVYFIYTNVLYTIHNITYTILLCNGRVILWNFSSFLIDLLNYWIIQKTFAMLISDYLLIFTTTKNNNVPIPKYKKKTNCS